MLNWYIFIIFKTPKTPKMKAKECFKLIVFLFKIATKIYVMIGIIEGTIAPPKLPVPCSTLQNINILYKTKKNDAKSIKIEVCRSNLYFMFVKNIIGAIDIKHIPIRKNTIS